MKIDGSICLLCGGPFQGNSNVIIFSFDREMLYLLKSNYWNYTKFSFVLKKITLEDKTFSNKDDLISNDICVHNAKIVRKTNNTNLTSLGLNYVPLL